MDQVVDVRTRAFLLIAVSGLLLAGCASDEGSQGSEATEVAALDNSFDPSSVSVATGDTVLWTNEGSNPHTVEIQPENGDSTVHSQEIDSGEETSYTFESEGAYEVWCRFHGSPGSGMHMTVQVGS